MKFGKFCVWIICGLLVATAYGSESGDAMADRKKPGFVSRVFSIFKGDPAKKEAKNLKITLALSPLPLELSETRRLQVNVTLTNASRKLIHLEFPTTQRIEILVRDTAGNLVVQWSEDQSFENVHGYVAINPREHIEYSTFVATRDMEPGKEYFVEVFFPNYDNLKVSEKITPQK